MKIGIVSEGVSDYAIIKHIVARLLRDKDPNIIPLKPKQKQNGKQNGYCSWRGVFNYISGSDDQKLIVEALHEGCDYVVVQIDTDVCEEYGVSHNQKTSETMWNDVRDKLAEKVHEDFEKTRLIFAICIDEIECWLIPFVDNKVENCLNTDRCLNILNRDIRQIGGIDKNNKNCDAARKIYETILSKKKKAKEIIRCSQYNYGFRKFVEQLNCIAK